MGNCDLCNCELSTVEGYVFTTKELVTSQDFWKRRLGLYGSLLEMLPTNEARYQFFLDNVHDACASASPWLLCEECSKVSPERESAKIEAQKQAKTGVVSDKFSQDLSLCTIQGETASGQRTVMVKDSDGHVEAMRLASLAFQSHYGKVDNLDSLENTKESSSSNEGCFIATAACGSIYAPDVIYLQDFRDKYMRKKPFGQWLIKQYYRVSPPLAHSIRKSLFMRLIVRYSIIKPIVFMAKLISSR